MAFPTTAGSLAAWTDQNANIPGTGTKANATNLNLLITEVNAITNTLGASALALSNLAEDPATTTALIWGYQAGRVVEDNVVRTIAAGTVNLTNNATNYIEFSAANDTMYVNQSAFTSGRKPIAKVITSGGFITQTVALRDQRTWLMVYAGAPVFAGSNYTITGTWTWGAHLLFTDNTYDIGASGATRPRTGYFGTSVVSPVLTAATSLTTPTIYGSAAAGGTLSLISTSGTGSNDAVHIKGGTNGGTTIASFFGAGTYAGNVGIGTTTPYGKLHVLGGTGQNVHAFGLGSPDYGGALFLTMDAGATQKAVRIRATGALGSASVYPNFGIDYSTTDQAYNGNPSTLTYANALTIEGRFGNVGIGTTGPASLTEIQGGLTTTGAVLTLGSKETSTVVNDVLGRINFYAPLDAAGTDAILVAGSIAAVAEGSFSATSNATSLIFQTGASEVATTKMTIASTGLVTISSGLVVSASGITSTGSVIHHTLDSASTGTALIIDGSDIIRPLTSAERYKENIRRDWQTDTEAFFALSPILFDYKNGGARDVLSFSADQSMALPYLVNRNNDGLPESLREHAFIAYLFNSAKADHARIAELERKLKLLLEVSKCEDS